MESLQSDILTAFAQVTAPDSKTQDVWVRPYRFDSKHQDLHQFLFFIKPEATAADHGVNVPEVLSLMLKKLEEGSQIGAVRILGGPYIDQSGIISEHYGVIAKISRNGESAISEDAKKKLHEAFGDKISAGYKVVGGHQALAELKSTTALQLKDLNDSQGTTKLAGGTYAMPATFEGKNFIILNAFHPFQVVPFCRPGSAIILFECKSALTWKTLRTNVCGATKPDQAASGSIRNTLLSRASELKMTVDMGSNGCHMSAGPLEAMVELQRFLSSREHRVPLTETSFGAQLTSRGVSETELARLASNVNITVNGKSVSTFDATEETDSTAALAILAPQ